MSYSDYLSSRHWLEFRDSALIAAQFRCEECGLGENLNVHHHTYKNIGKESLDDVSVLCFRWHMELHETLSSAILHNKRRELAIQNIIDDLILKDEDEIMECSNCGRKEIFPASWHSAKLGCICGEEHQRWNISIYLTNFLFHKKL